MYILQILSVGNWIWVLLAAFIIGMAKAGLKGIDMLNITIMAIVFGGKASTGIVLPLLCVADIAAVWYYKRHVQWVHFFKIIPWMAIGILIGVYVGKAINEVLFRKMMAIIILVTIVIMLIMELRKNKAVPTHTLFVASTGLAAGFTTMLGNLAGAFANIYFLAMQMPKNKFIGTAAWVFLVINLFKLPFQIFYWKNITPQSLLMDIWLLPALALGFIVGLKTVAIIKDEYYRKIIIALTFIGAWVIFLK